jgi:hypothetical protein
VLADLIVTKEIVSVGRSLRLCEKACIMWIYAFAANEAGVSPLNFLNSDIICA